MRFRTLNEWLSWQEALHAQSIDLGLERVKRVHAALGNDPVAPVVILVGGTNGKGSTVAFIEAFYRAAGYRLGVYTSPHLIRYNERIRIDGECASDEAICEAFGRVDQARQEISLTYFEFGTLAALDIFRRNQLEIVVLEVGLGGRLDAVNIIEPTLSVVTTIGLDHTQWLGDTRDRIATEKLGIARRGTPLVIGERQPPSTMLDYVHGNSVDCHRLGIDFERHILELQGETQWQWSSRTANRELNALPLPALRGNVQLDNASVALQAVALLGQRYPVTSAEIKQGLHEVVLPGRQQLIVKQHQYWLDVAHNEDAIQSLATMLASKPAFHRRYAVIGAMKDKAVDTMFMPLLEQIDHWCVCSLTTERAASAAVLKKELISQGIKSEQISEYDSVADALRKIPDMALPESEIYIFGSFYTVSEALGLLTE